LANERITLSSINATDLRYQNRDPRTGTYGEKESEKLSSKGHIKNIVKHLEDDPKNKVEKIEVTYDPTNTDMYIIVDGFHRYAAFKEINKKTKGKRFKQIRVKLIKEVTEQKALSINTEHTAKSLTHSQKTENQWQKFLGLMRDNPSVSKKETVEALGITSSTVDNWRRDRKTFMEAGFFEKTSQVAKNEVTGFPMLKPSRDMLRSDTGNEPQEESEGQLVEGDKKALAAILKMVKKSKEPDKLNKMVNHFWGENPNHVDYDIVLEDVEQVYEGF
tara:strand:+ start:2001 stop:2825 length:825 start_codon:yes stop_codon:yes gene_type:complete